MQRESNIHAWQLLSQDAWQEEKLVVVNDDDVNWFVDVHDGISKALVETLVVSPCLLRRLLVCKLALPTMKDRGDDLFCISIPVLMIAKNESTGLVDFVR